MSKAQTLSRPLAARIAALPQPAESLNPTPPLNEGLVDAALDALDAGKTHYTDRPGILPLRQWISGEMERRYALAVKPEAVTITCDVIEARFVALKQMPGHGTLVLTPEATIPRIAAAAHLSGISLCSTIEAAPISTLYLAEADIEDAAAISPWLEAAHEHLWWIIWEMDSGGSGSFHPAQREGLAERVLSIGGFGGQIPGWQIGWMAGSEMAGKLRAFKQSMTICSTSIAQWAALGMVKHS